MDRKVLIALARGVCRDGLLKILDSIPNLAVVGEAADGRAAIARARDARPDIVILEANLPGLNGVETTRQLVAENPGVAVIAVAAVADQPLVAGFLHAGVKGFVLADGGARELQSAIEQVVQGHIHLSPSVEDHVISSLDSFAASAGNVLTVREREVLQLLAEGKSTRDIAATLSVSTKTVETHRMKVMTKLKIRTVAGLTKYAIRNGLTSVR